MNCPKINFLHPKRNKKSKEELEAFNFENTIANKIPFSIDEFINLVLSKKIIFTELPMNGPFNGPLIYYTQKVWISKGKVFKYRIDNSYTCGSFAYFYINEIDIDRFNINVDMHIISGLILQGKDLRDEKMDYNKEAIYDRLGGL